MTERRHLIHNGELLVYHLRRSPRARQVSVTIELDGRVILVMPKLMPEWLGTRFLKKRADWALKSVTDMAKYKDHIMLPSGRADYLRYKERARALAHECAKTFNHHYGFTYNRIAIKNLRRNWGSCSAKSNLNFNYKIYHLPRAHAEYIVVHELCHLKEFNHSKRFWDLVSETIPNHKTLRRELRKYLI